MHNENIEEWLKQHEIDEIECLVPNMTGFAVGKFISVQAFLEGNNRLPEGLLAATVTGGYADTHYDFLSPKDIDAILVADNSTARLVPWATTPTAQIIHDCLDSEGNMHPVASRSVLRRVLALYKEQGWTPVVAPEMEFYLIDKNIDPSEPLQTPVGSSGRRETGALSYGIDGMNEFSAYVDSLYEVCEQQNIDVDGLVHESGAAQFEINFKHGDPLSLADQVFAFKRSVRQVAFQHDLYATFMAKPFGEEPGSSMHIHQSVVDTQGNNIFVDEQGNEHERFLHFIGGLQKYTPFCFSLYAPNVNSYRRFSAGGHGAPANMTWGYDNRCAALRVPDSEAAAKRVENRFPGADTNPYLAIAASLACGYLGMKHKVAPSKPHQGSANEETITVPRDLLSSVNLLDDSPELVEVFSAQFVEAYKAVKGKEYEDVNNIVTTWEREHLLLTV